MCLSIGKCKHDSESWGTLLYMSSKSVAVYAITAIIYRPIFRALKKTAYYHNSQYTHTHGRYIDQSSIMHDTKLLPDLSSHCLILTQVTKSFDLSST